MNYLYLLGLILIPFDNLFFAPSSGWATISPIIFFLYIFLNMRKTLYIILKKEYILISIFYFLCTYSMILYLFNPLNISNALGGFQTIILGLAFYIAMIIRYIIDKKNFDDDLKYLLYAYIFSFIYGVVKYIGLKFNLGFLLNLFSIMEKRFYDRVAFSFTEPSFIGLHLFGILLPIYFISKSQKNRKKIIYLIISFSSLTIFSQSSARLIIDIVFVLILLLFYFILHRKFKVRYKLVTVYFLLFIAIIFGITGFNKLTQNSRIDNIISNGIYSDSSLAARYFRINASINGYIKQPSKMIFGLGIGNSYLFLEEGFDEAFSEYKNPYTYEVLWLRTSKSDQLFCLPIRLISEFGILITIILISFLLFYSIKKENNMFLMFTILYLYIQFDSYAFYSLWLYIFYNKYNRKLNYAFH